MKSTNLPDTPAVAALVKVLESGIDPSRIDQVYDMLKLMGLVLGHSTLLAVATNPAAEAKDRVAAAKSLIHIKDSPEDIAERLQKSKLADLSVDELKTIVRKLESGERNLLTLVKESDDGTSGPAH